MKAIRTVEGLAVNPVFSAAKRRAATAENQPYDVPEFIVMTSKLSDAEQRHLSQLEKAYAVDLKLAEEQKANALPGVDPATGNESAGSSDAGSSGGGGGTSSENTTKPAKDQTSGKGKA
jgi:hypothetical protein